MTKKLLPLSLLLFFALATLSLSLAARRSPVCARQSFRSQRPSDSDFPFADRKTLKTGVVEGDSEFSAGPPDLWVADESRQNPVGVSRPLLALASSAALKVRAAIFQPVLNL